MIQNLVWATGYNASRSLSLRASSCPGASILSMAAGAVAMSLSTIIVAANAQLLGACHFAPDRSLGTPDPSQTQAQGQAAWKDGKG